MKLYPVASRWRMVRLIDGDTRHNTRRVSRELAANNSKHRPMSLSTIPDVYKDVFLYFEGVTRIRWASTQLITSHAVILRRIFLYEYCKWCGAMRCVVLCCVVLFCVVFCRVVLLCIVFCRVLLFCVVFCRVVLCCVSVVLWLLMVLSKRTMESSFEVKSWYNSSTFLLVITKFYVRILDVQSCTTLLSSDASLEYRVVVKPLAVR